MAPQAHSTMEARPQNRSLDVGQRLQALTLAEEGIAAKTVQSITDFIQMPKIILFKCRGLFHSNARGYFIQMRRVYFIQMPEVISFKCRGLFHSNAGGYFI
jgi:uncharacterized membrane protein YobD (UPF0266 family)